LGGCLGSSKVREEQGEKRRVSYDASTGRAIKKSWKKIFRKTSHRDVNAYSRRGAKDFVKKSEFL